MYDSIYLKINSIDIQIKYSGKWVLHLSIYKNTDFVCVINKFKYTSVEQQIILLFSLVSKKVKAKDISFNLL